AIRAVERYRIKKFFRKIEGRLQASHPICAALTQKTIDLNRSNISERFCAAALPLSDCRRGVVLGEFGYGSPFGRHRAGSRLHVCVSGFGQMGGSLRGQLSIDAELPIPTPRRTAEYSER